MRKLLLIPVDVERDVKKREISDLDSRKVDPQSLGRESRNRALEFTSEIYAKENLGRIVSTFENQVYLIQNTFIRRTP